MNSVTGSDTTEAAGWLMKGFAIGIPTETVYGLAANATDTRAVASIFAIKNRPVFDPLIVHVARPEDVEMIAHVTDLARKLMRRFWPGPLTILLPKKAIIPDLVTSGLPTVGVRMPDHPLTLELLGKLPFPLAAPSANPFGYISPTSARHVHDQLGDKIPYILDGGDCRVGVESTIVTPLEERLLVHRVGGIALEELALEGWKPEIYAGGQAAPVAPGMLESHYAPGKPLLFGTAETLFAHILPGSALICLSKPSLNFPSDLQVVELSPEGDLSLAASRLFAVMRQLDAGDCKQILALQFPEEGLGRAINDRLRRAAVKRQA